MEGKGVDVAQVSAEHQKFAKRGTFHEFEGGSDKNTNYTPTTHPWVCSWCLRCGGRGVDVVLEMRGRKKDVLNTEVTHCTPKTCPCGHFFHVQDKDEGEGMCQTPNHTPQEHVLVFGMREGRGEHILHHKHTLVGVFVVFKMRERRGNMLNTKNIPHMVCF